MFSISEATQRLHRAIIDGEPVVVIQAIKDGADVRAFRVDGYSTLAFIDNTLILKLLLDAGADPNYAPDGSAPDALYWAASGGRLEITRMLVAAGASVEADRRDYERDRHDWDSSVHVAVESGNMDLLMCLLAAGGKSVLDCFNYISRTPLMIAVERGDLKMAQQLIEAGSDVNAVDEVQIGNPAIRHAAESQGLEMIKLLLDAGADPRVKGWMWLTAIDKARDRKDGLGPQIVSLLESAVARLSHLR
jgi:ankyrin repeat protein